MPTTRPRHVITETDQIALALDDAARRWPDEPDRRKLLLLLSEEGRRVVTGEQQRSAAARRAALARTSGALTGLYGEGYLERLREDWPA